MNAVYRCNLLGEKKIRCVLLTHWSKSVEGNTPFESKPGECFIRLTVVAISDLLCSKVQCLWS